VEVVLEIVCAVDRVRRGVLLGCYGSRDYCLSNSENCAVNRYTFADHCNRN
jgi:hypothetical protein